MVADQVHEAIRAAKLETVLCNKKLEKLRTEVRRLFDRTKSNQSWDVYESKRIQYNKEICKEKKD